MAENLRHKTTKDFWKRKLMAYLHDPPDKPLGIAGHVERAEAYQDRGDLDVSDAVLSKAELDRAEFANFYKVCDHTAAAADRFPFPVPRKLSSRFGGDEPADFLHPLGGSRWKIKVPSVEEAEKTLQECQPAPPRELENIDERWWANFFLHWRRWPRAAAEKDGSLLYLPADTRIPDHSIWAHMAVVSALESCVDSTGGQPALRPAFLLFQLGPVQDFIQQARSTRDLWSGSYLLSWLMAHAMKAVTDQVGPDAVIFPSLRGQPIFDLLHRSELYERSSFRGKELKEESLWYRLGFEGEEGKRLLLTPTLPNRFLAVVPEASGEDLARRAEKAVRGELRRIAEVCWKWLEGKRETLAEAENSLAGQWTTNAENWRRRFDAQVEKWPQITWQVAPWAPAAVEEALTAYAGLTDQGAAWKNLSILHRLAVEGIPVDDRDPRYFSDSETRKKLNNPGFAWPYYYASTDWLLAARRRLRDFDKWETDEHQKGSVKDSLSGLEEVIGSEELWRALQGKFPWLFRSRDRLGAPNLIKRLWPDAYLGAGAGPAVPVKELRIRSVPAVAAGDWQRRLCELAARHEEVWERILDLRNVLIKHKKLLAEEFLVSGAGQETCWIWETDPDCFRQERILDVLGKGASLEDHAAVEEIQGALKALYELKDAETHNRLVPPPPSYVAILALDGDQMGRWVSGEKTPPFLDQLSTGAQEYFSKLKSPATEDLTSKKPTRPLSPSYHLQFSESLANFSLYLVRPIVESFGGRLIYSGGDDVLAMLPAERSLECAVALRAAFRGEKALERLVEGRFEVLGENGGFVRVLRPGYQKEEVKDDCRPDWPLVVPGPRADCSVGIAIGHIHAPLQNLVRAAQEAEQRAKLKLGRGACAVSLYKRSGEILEWGFRWGAANDESEPLPSDKLPAVELFREFWRLSTGEQCPEEKPLLSSRFAYHLRQLVQPYAGVRGRRKVMKDVPDLPIQEILQREVKFAVNRHWLAEGPATREEQENFLRLVGDYLSYVAGRLNEREEPDGGDPDRKVSAIAVQVESLLGLFDTANFILREEEA